MAIHAVLPMKRGDDWKLNVGSIPAGDITLTGSIAYALPAPGNRSSENGIENKSTYFSVVPGRATKVTSGALRSQKGKTCSSGPFVIHSWRKLSRRV
jgi:hypothetical protein